MTSLGLESNGFWNSQAFGINELNQIVGVGNQSSGMGGIGFRYDGGTITTLGANTTYGYDINESGQIVGNYADNAAGDGYIYESGVATTFDSLPGAVLTYGYAINDSGVAVGGALNASYLAEAFVYAGGTASGLGTLGGSVSFANDINNAGVVVGGARTADEVEHGFAFVSGTMYDLNDLLIGSNGWEVINAQALNDLGQIVGTAKFEGVTYGVLLSPVSAVPEPSTYVFLAGLAAFGLVASRRRKQSNGRSLGSALKIQATTPVLLTLACLSVAVPMSVRAQTSYSLSVIPTPGYPSLAVPRAINNSGEIVGTYYENVAPYSTYGFIYSGGVSSDLGTLGGTYTAPEGISDAGTVTGTSYDGSAFYAFVWDNGSMTSLGLGSFGATETYGRAINSAGQVAGNGWVTSIDPDSEVGFRYSGGAFGVLPNLGGAYPSVAYDINESGDVVGVSDAGDGGPIATAHAYVDRDGVITDLGTLGGSGSVAYAINDVGQITGTSYTDTFANLPFIWENGVMTPLGTLGSTAFNWAWGINNLGDVVGASNLESGDKHGYLFTDGTMIDLNSTLINGDGWVFTEAFDINDNGEIIGVATLDGLSWGVLLSPVSAVPEPSSYAILVGIVAMVGAVSRRRRK